MILVQMCMKPLNYLCVCLCLCVHGYQCTESRKMQCLCEYLESFLISVYLRPRVGCQPHSRRGRTVSGRRVGQTSTCSFWDSSAPQRAAPASAHSCPPPRTGTDPEHPGQSVPCRPSLRQSQSNSCPGGRSDKQSSPHMSSPWHAPPPHPQQTGSSP